MLLGMTRRPSTDSVEGTVPEVGARYGRKEYDDESQGTGAARSSAYERYPRRRTDTDTPEPLRAAYKKIEDNAERSEEVGPYDLKTLATIIKSLRSEKKDVNEASNEVEDGRRERTEPLARRGPQSTSIKPQGSSASREPSYKGDVDSRLPQRTAAYLDQEPARKQAKLAAKEHLLKLLEELNKLEEINKMQRALNPNDDNTEYNELREELTDDVKSIRYKARQAIRELQQLL